MKDISDKMMQVGELSVDKYLSGWHIYALDVCLPPDLETFFIEKMCSIEELAKMYRICIWTENYEEAYELAKEINKRGYSITIQDNLLKFSLIIQHLPYQPIKTIQLWH